MKLKEPILNDCFFPFQERRGRQREGDRTAKGPGSPSPSGGNRSARAKPCPITAPAFPRSSGDTAIYRELQDLFTAVAHQISPSTCCFLEKPQERLKGCYRSEEGACSVSAYRPGMVYPTTLPLPMGQASGYLPHNPIKQ